MSVHALGGNFILFSLINQINMFKKYEGGSTQNVLRTMLYCSEQVSRN